MKGTLDCSGSSHGGPHSRTGQTQTRRSGGGREEEEAKTVAAQTAGGSSHAARRTQTHIHARTHTLTCTRTHTNSSFLDEATPKTEGWFMRRSGPMGIRACSGIRLNKKEESRFWQQNRIKEVGKRLCWIFWQQTKWKSPDQIFSYFLGCYITLCVKNTLNRSF